MVVVVVVVCRVRRESAAQAATIGDGLREAQPVRHTRNLHSALKQRADPTAPPVPGGGY